MALEYLGSPVVPWDPGKKILKGGTENQVR